MDITREQKIKLYTNMVRIRKLDEFIVQAFYDGKLAGPFFHSQQGQEAVGVGACTFLRPDDYMFHTHRGHGICESIAKGLPAKSFVAEHFGKVTGSCKGTGFINSCDPKLGFFGMGGTVGGEFTVGTGIALAAKLRGKGQVMAIFFGDGATGRGTLHEGMLMSANWKLPVIWLCENNLMGQWVPIKIAYPKENLADLAFGYDIPSAIVDGQDVIAVYEAVSEAAVAGLPDPKGKVGEITKAWVALKPEYKEKITEEELIAWTEKNMTKWKCPAIIEFIDEIPKNILGKVQRRVLQEADPLYKK